MHLISSINKINFKVTQIPVEMFFYKLNAPKKIKSQRSEIKLI